MEDGYLYLRLRNMSHTIYAAKFEQTIIHQHVHLRRENQSHAPAHVQMRLYLIDKSLEAKEGRYVRIVNLSCISHTHVYSEHKCRSHGD